jgi:hypothetical protein
LDGGAKVATAGLKRTRLLHCRDPLHVAARGEMGVGHGCCEALSMFSRCACADANVRAHNLLKLAEVGWFRLVYLVRAVVYGAVPLSLLLIL